MTAPKIALTRRQILAVVAGEGAAWTAVGAAAGMLLGFAETLVASFVDPGLTLAVNYAVFLLVLLFKLEF